MERTLSEEIREITLKAMFKIALHMYRRGYTNAWCNTIWELAMNFNSDYPDAREIFVCEGDSTEDTVEFYIEDYRMTFDI